MAVGLFNYCEILNGAAKNQNIFISDKLYLALMAETITIPKEEYEKLLEEVGILRNKDMMEAIKESDEAKEKETKTWELNTHR